PAARTARSTHPSSWPLPHRFHAPRLAWLEAATRMPGACRTSDWPLRPMRMVLAMTIVAAVCFTTRTPIMTHRLAALAIALAAGSASAQSTPVGVWKTIDDDGKTEKSLVRITEAGGALAG